MSTFLAGFYILYITNYLTTDRQQALNSLAINTKNEIERVLTRGYDDVQFIANSHSFNVQTHLSGELLDSLNLIQETYGIYDDIVVLDLDGNVISSTTYSYHDQFGKKDWFKKARDGSVVVSNAHMILDKSLPVINYLAPIRSTDGNITAVVSIQYPLDHLWDITDKISTNKKLNIYLLNPFGMYIVHPDKKMIFSRANDDLPLSGFSSKDGVIEYETKDDRQMIGGYSKMFDSVDYMGEGWTVVVEESRDQYLAVIKNSYIILGLSSVILILLIILLYFKLNSWFIVPIDVLQKGINSVKEADFTTPVHLAGNDEMSELAKGIDQMRLAMKSFTHRLKGANSRINRLLTVRTQFINRIAHDLRTPLVPILTLLPLIERKITEKKQKEIMTIILNNVTYLNALISDTLSLSRMDSGKIKYSPEQIDVLDLLSSIIKSNEPVFKKSGTTVVMGIQKKIPSIYADRNSIIEVLENMITNALKYMASGGKISFSAETKKDSVLFCIKDSGIGIPKEDIQKVFEEFYRVDKSHHEKSSGLGLAICQR
ncbi:hypothetical protein COV93_07990, partial [Candidatus Woesearchaeota archaeon CG11_big_fil_rev_8_21_14_0_20_43_8]